MKGMIFTEFIEMAENKFGISTTQEAIDNANLPNKGAYTAVGTYDHQEMQRLAGELCKATQTEPGEMLRMFGHLVFAKFVKGYGVFFEGISDPFDFLEKIETYIHPEVLKLYPDAELPRFESERLQNGSFRMIYISSRHMSAFAYGLIEACMVHFGVPSKIETESDTDPGKVSFLITRL